MRGNRFATVLMLAGLLAGQWLVVAHAQQHASLAASDAACQMCLHAQGLDSGVAPTLLPVVPEIVTAAPIVEDAPSASFSAPRFHPIRAPPLSLA
jgi:hypothetical protein